MYVMLGVMKITERESAHPGNVTLPAELVTSNGMTKEIVKQSSNQGDCSPTTSSPKVFNFSYNLTILINRTLYLHLLSPSS